MCFPLQDEGVFEVEKLLSCVIAVLGTISFVSPALASPVTSAAAVTANAVNTMTRETGESARHKISLVSDLIGNGVLITHVSEDELKIEDSLVYVLSERQGGGSVVIVPIADPYAVMSNFIVYLDDSGTVSRYNEALVDGSTSDTFKIKQYADGALTRSDVSDIPYKTNDELKEELTAESVQQRPMARANPTACATMAFGMGTGFGAILAWACAGSCVSGVGAPVCIACIGLYATVSYSSINTFMNCLKA